MNKLKFINLKQKNTNKAGEGILEKITVNAYHIISMTAFPDNEGTSIIMTGGEIMVDDTIAQILARTQ